MVEGHRELHDRTDRDLAVDDPGPLRHLAHREDRRLTRGQDRQAAVDPEHPDVGQRDRAAEEVRRPRLPRAGQRHRILDPPRQRDEVVGLRLADDRDDEPTSGVRGDAEAHLVRQHDLRTGRGVVPHAVQQRLLPDRVDEGGRGQDERRQADTVRLREVAERV